MGDEAFQTKKNEPTHISLRCLEQAVCCRMYCNSGPNFPRSPADVTSGDAECANVSDRETDTLLWSPGDCLVVRMNRKTAVNNSVTKSAALLWRLHARSRAGLADGCSYPNDRRVTIESYL